jgi:putative membrane protein
LGRIFGLSELRLEVAGGAGSDVKLAYLRDHEADRLRNALLAKAAGLAYDGDEAPVAPEQHLVDVPPGLLLGSLLLSTFTVWVLIALIGVTAIGIVEPGALLGMVPMLIGGASAVWARFARSFGFRVAFSADGLRLRHGLLETRTQTVLPGRVQAVLMYQPLLWRLRDWWALRINVAGYAGLGTENNESPQTVLVPVASRSDALLLLAQILPDLGHPDPLRLLDEGLVGAAGDGPTGFTTAPRQSRWLDPISWRRHGVAVTRRALLMRSGRLTRRLVLVPHERTQSLGLRQGWLQRRFGVATLVAHSTPGPVTPKVEHLAAMTAAHLLDEQAARARAARAVAGPERWMEKGPPPAG